MLRYQRALYKVNGIVINWCLDTEDDDYDEPDDRTAFDVLSEVNEVAVQAIEYGTEWETLRKEMESVEQTA